MRILVTGLGAVLFLGALTTAGAWAEAIKPADPQPAADELQPGLAVVYYNRFFRHISELVDWEGYKEGTPGEPILQVNFRSGQGNVLTSNNDDGVGARMTGFIRFDQPGDYKFAFESNDGVRLEIGGEMVLQDPDVHGDRFSDIGRVTVAEPGWYPITIRYFERKNTSTLRFHWSPPETEGTMPLVPAEALSHKPG